MVASAQLGHWGVAPAPDGAPARALGPERRGAGLEGEGRGRSRGMEGPRVPARSPSRRGQITRQRLRGSGVRCVPWSLCNRELAGAWRILAELGPNPTRSL